MTDQLTMQLATVQAILFAQGSAAQRIAAQYPVPADILAAARTPVSPGGYRIDPIAPYAAGGGLAAVLNFGAIASPADVTGYWTAFEGAVTLNTSPPAGCPTPWSVHLVPSGSGANPHGYTGLFACYPGCTYVVTAVMNAVSAADSLQVGIDWGSSANAAYLSTSSIPGSNPTANTWTTVTGTFVAPAGAWYGLPWSGNGNASNIPAGHTVDTSSCAVTGL